MASCVKLPLTQRMNAVCKYAQVVMQMNVPHRATPLMISHAETFHIYQREPVQSFARLLAYLANLSFRWMWCQSLTRTDKSGETQFSETSSEIRRRSITTRAIPTRPSVTATDCFLLCRPLSGVWQWAPGQHLTINQRAQPLHIACWFFPLHYTQTIIQVDTSDT